MSVGGLTSGNDQIQTEAMGQVRIAEEDLDGVVSSFSAAKDAIDEAWGIYASAFGDEIASTGETAQEVNGLCETAKGEIDDIIGQINSIKNESVPKVLATLNSAVDSIVGYIGRVSGSSST